MQSVDVQDEHTREPHSLSLPLQVFNLCTRGGAVMWTTRANYRSSSVVVYFFLRTIVGIDLWTSDMLFFVIGRWLSFLQSAPSGKARSLLEDNAALA